MILFFSDSITTRAYSLDTKKQIAESEFFTLNLLVRIHFIIVMIRWTGLAPWEFEISFPGSITSTFRVPLTNHSQTPD